jgi:hypothetical protein
MLQLAHGLHDMGELELEISLDVPHHLVILYLSRENLKRSNGLETVFSPSFSGQKTAWVT